MMAVTLEQLRRARTMRLADDLRMERDLVRHCFHRRPGSASRRPDPSASMWVLLTMRPSP